MLIAKDITMKYDRVIFDGFSYVFEDNKIYCILGKSGIGKTTLLRILAGLQKPDRGIVTFNDKKVTKPNLDIFMMHQQYTNFPWKTCYENVIMPLELKGIKPDKETVLYALENVGLKEYINKYPYELSNGMQQRLALVRTMMCEPKVILMDEPLSALDPKNRSEMQDLILDFQRTTKNTIIMVTHDPDEARKMNNVIINL